MFELLFTIFDVKVSLKKTCIKLLDAYGLHLSCLHELFEVSTFWVS